VGEPGHDVVFPHRLPADSVRAPRRSSASAMDSLTCCLSSKVRGIATRSERHRHPGGQSFHHRRDRHAFGPDSREIHDQVLRLDRYLAWFLKRVTDRSVVTTFVIRADGRSRVTSLPERTAPRRRARISRAARYAHQP